MASALRRIVNWFTGAGKDHDAGGVFVAAFGKHPGWEDHLEALGLETSFLVDIKRILYVEGLGGAIASGAWEKAEPAHRLEKFAHLFVWAAAADIVIGRMWSSQDAKGRALYPMVVCAHCSGLPPTWAFENVPLLLEELEHRCVATHSASEVIAAVDEARQLLRQRAAQCVADGPEPEGAATVFQTLAARPEMGPDHRGLLRVLYQVEQSMQGFFPGAPRASESGTLPEPQQIRVPQCNESPAASALLWLRFVRCLLDRGTPVLLVVPLREPWLDVLVGVPRPSQLECIRAAAKALPLTTEIPFQWDEDFVKRSEARIAGTYQASPVTASRRRRAPPRGPRPGVWARLKARKSLLIGALILIGLSGLLALGVAVTARLLSRQDPSAVLAGKWNELCGQYNDWFESFAKNVDPDFLKRVNPSASEEDVGSVRRRRQAWEGDAFLKELAASVAEFNKQKLEPPALAGNRPPYYDSCPRWESLYPDEQARIRAEEELRGRVTAALDIVQRRVGDRLTSWPELKGVVEAGQQWPRWPGRSRCVKEWVSSVGRNGNLAQTLEQIRVAADVARRWPEVAAAVEAVAKSPDIRNTPLAEFSEFVRDETDPDPTKQPDADFRALDSRLCEWTEGPQPVVRAMADFVTKDWPRLHRACVQRYPPGEFPGNTSAHYWNWLQKVRSPDAPYWAFEKPPAELSALRQRLEDAQRALAAADQEIGRAGTDWPAPIGATVVKRLADEAAKDRAGLKTQADRLGELAGARWCNKCWEPLGKPQVARLSNDLAEASRAASGSCVRVWQEKVKAVKEATRQEIETLIAALPDEDRVEAVRKRAEVRKDCNSLEQTLERLAAAPGNEASTREVLSGLEGVRSRFVELQGVARRDPRATWVNPWKGLIAELEKGIADAVPAEGAAAGLRRQTARLDERIVQFGRSAYEPGNAAQLAQIRREKAEIEAELARCQEAVQKERDKWEPRRWEEWPRRLAQLRKDAGGLAAARLAGLPEPLRKRLEEERAAIDTGCRGIEGRIAGLPRREVRWNDVPRKAEVLAECKQINVELGAVEPRAAACSGWVRAAESLAKDMAEVLGAASPAPASEAIAAFWKSERDRLAKAAVEGLRPDAAEAAARGSQLKSHAGRLEQLLVHLANRRFSTDLEKKSTAPWAQPLAQALGRKREALLAQTVKGLPLPPDYASLPDRGDAAADQRLDAYLKGVSAQPQADWKSFCDSATRLDSQFVAILDEMEKGDIEGKAVAKWAQAARGPAYLELQGVFAPVTDRIGTLEAIDKTVAVSTLVEYTRQARVNAWEAAWAAWRKLGASTDWPGTPQQLAEERAIRDRLTRAGAPADTVIAQGCLRWERYFIRLQGEKAIAAAIEDKDLKELDPAKINLATTAAPELLRLSNPLARYRLLRWAWTKVDLEKIDDAALGTIKNNFVKLARDSAAEVCDREPVRGFLAALATLTRKEEAGGDPANSGPGAVGWRLQLENPATGTVAYTLRRPEAPELTLTFVRVTPPGGTGCYLCTTEVSVGLMQAVVNAPEAWSQIGQLEPFHRIIGAKSWGTWQGPRPWRIRPDGSGLQVSERWLRETVPPDIAYPPQLKDKVPGPTAGHPMNDLSPDAAIYLARLLGCRLPTAAEWKAAYQAVKAEARWNLRDAGWASQRDYAAKRPTTILPDEHIFVPDKSEVAKGPDAVVRADASDDGTLWFAEVDSDKDHVFHHLVGNVAEYVLEDPARGQEALVVGTKLRAGEVQAFLENTKGAGLAVIGGSALSPPEVKWDDPYPCKLLKARDAFSDVGFRLAFTASQPRLRSRVVELLKSEGGRLR
jgi:hypothetical protein